IVDSIATTTAHANYLNDIGLVFWEIKCYIFKYVVAAHNTVFLRDYSAFSKKSLNLSAHFSKKLLRFLVSLSSPVFVLAFSLAGFTSGFSSEVVAVVSVFGSEILPWRSRLSITNPTAVAYTGLLMASSLLPAKCSLGYPIRVSMP